jgi:hypothetical protein
MCRYAKRGQEQQARSADDKLRTERMDGTTPEIQSARETREQQTLADSAYAIIQRRMQQVQM